MSIDQVISDLIGREGSYSNDASDSGGETKYGITRAVASAFGYSGAMALLPRETAATIYRERYWRQPGFDKVEALCPALAEELLDTGVNMGTGTAGQFLQRALNVLNRGATIFPDLTVDGRVGPMALAAIAAFLKSRGKPGELVLLRLMNSQQAVRYMELAENSPKNEDFTFGWILNRVS